MTLDSPLFSPLAGKIGNVVFMFVMTLLAIMVKFQSPDGEIDNAVRN